MFADNTATGYGGAIFLSPENTTPLPVFHCTFDGNTAGNGGHAVAIERDARPRLLNNIVWGQSTNLIAIIRAASMQPTLTIGSSVIENGLDTIQIVLGGTVVDQGGLLTNAPLWVAVAEGDFSLQGNSPAIAAGVNLVPDYPEAAFDFAGTPRPQGAGMDIGALEFVGPATPPTGLRLLVR